MEMALRRWRRGRRATAAPTSSSTGGDVNVVEPIELQDGVAPFPPGHRRLRRRRPPYTLLLLSLLVLALALIFRGDPVPASASHQEQRQNDNNQRRSPFLEG